MRGGNAFRKSALMLGLAFVVTGCLGSLPDTVQLHIVNDPDPGHPVCAGGLKTTFRLGSLLMDDTAPLKDSKLLQAVRPADAPQGAIVSLEAWCYSEASEELGYFKLEKPWHASVANWFINVYSSLPPEDREICLVGTEERGAAPCVSSGLLE